VRNTREIQDWLIAHIAGLLQVGPDSINIRETFSSYGLSSIDVVSLSGELEEYLTIHHTEMRNMVAPDVQRLKKERQDHINALYENGQQSTCNQPGNQAD
jgi:acyl carrier protein